MRDDVTEPKHHVYHSAVLDADVDTVWPVMRDMLQVVESRPEHERSLTYRTIGQALSLVDYVATYHVSPVTNDGSQLP